MDATGLLVTPGLVDLHTHVDGVPGPWGVDARVVAARTGVTSWVDAGSAGADNVAELRAHGQSLPLRLWSLLNISRSGLATVTDENADLRRLDVRAAVDAVAAHPEFVRGVKVRIDRRTVGANGLEPLRRAIAVAREVARPVMVHIGFGPPAVSDIVPLLRAGDILTHCAPPTPHGLVSGGRITEAVRAAVDAGVHLDVGHGSGSFSFAVAEIELAAGIIPICSSDLNARSVDKPGGTLPEVMAKMLALGMTLPDVVAAATSRPACVLGLGETAGVLSVGRRADLVLFRLVPGRGATATDCAGGTRILREVLEPVATFIGGREFVVPPRAGQPRANGRS